MAGAGRGRDATVPAWMAPGAPTFPPPSQPGSFMPQDIEEAARAALLGEQEAAMRAALTQQSGQKRGFDERDGPAQPHEDPAALKVCGFRCLWSLWSLTNCATQFPPLCSPADGAAQERLLKLEAEGRQGAAGAAAGPQHERGAGDWQQYQPPSAVLASIAARSAGPRPPGPPRRPPGPPRLPPGPPPAARAPAATPHSAAGQFPPPPQPVPPRAAETAAPVQHQVPPVTSAAQQPAPGTAAPAPAAAATPHHAVDVAAADGAMTLDADASAASEGNDGGGTPRGELRPPRPSYFSKPVLHAQQAEPTPANEPGLRHSVVRANTWSKLSIHTSNFHDAVVMLPANRVSEGLMSRFLYWYASVHGNERLYGFVAAEQPAEASPAAKVAAPAKKALPAALLARLKARGIAVAAEHQQQQQQHANQPVADSTAPAASPEDTPADIGAPPPAQNGSAPIAAPAAGNNLAVSQIKGHAGVVKPLWQLRSARGSCCLTQPCRLHHTTLHQRRPASMQLHTAAIQVPALTFPVTTTC